MTRKRDNAPPRTFRAMRQDEVSAAITRISLMMARGQWTPGASHIAMAEEMGASIDRVKGWATDASRALAIYHQLSPSELRAELLVNVEAVRHAAMTNERHWIDKHTGEMKSRPEPNYEAAIKSLDLRARVIGALAPTKVDIQTVASHEEWKKLPLTEKKRYLEMARARLADAEAEVMAEERSNAKAYDTVFPPKPKPLGKAYKRNDIDITEITEEEEEKDNE